MATTGYSRGKGRRKAATAATTGIRKSMAGSDNASGTNPAPAPSTSTDSEPSWKPAKSATPTGKTYGSQVSAAAKARNAARPAEAPESSTSTTPSSNPTTPTTAAESMPAWRAGLTGGSAISGAARDLSGARFAGGTHSDTMPELPAGTRRRRPA
jgi:hypothetical protein